MGFKDLALNVSYGNFPKNLRFQRKIAETSFTSRNEFASFVGI